MPHPLWTRGLFLMYPRTRYTCSTRQVRQKKVHIAWSSMIMHQNEGSLSCELPSKTGKSRVSRHVLSFSQGEAGLKGIFWSKKNRIGSNKHNRPWARFDLTSLLPWNCKTERLFDKVKKLIQRLLLCSIWCYESQILWTIATQALYIVTSDTL